MHLLPNLLNPQYLAGIPAKLSEDDSFVLLADLWVPSAAAVASLLVAGASAYIANKAYRMAKESEAARADAELHRVDAERQLRFDAALKDLYLGIAQRIVELRHHDAGVRTLAFNVVRGGSGVTLPARPDISSVLALISAARLDAWDEDTQHMLKVVASFTSSIADTGSAPLVRDTSTERELRLKEEMNAWKHLLEQLQNWREAAPGGRNSIVSDLRARTT